MDTNKILIIASKRCGGTYLMKALATHYRCYAVSEPDKLEDYGNHVVVKANASKHTTEDLVNYSKNFDKVILLDRLNKEEQIQSATWMFHNDTSNVKWKWDNKLIGTPAYNKAVYEIELLTERLNALSQELEVEITYYEDIYFGNKSIEGFQPILNKKLRQVDKEKLIH